MAENKFIKVYMSNDIAIKVQNLTKTYKLYNSPQDRLKESLHPLRKKYHHDFYALNDVSFEVKKGEMVGIIGINGSGKSTLLKIITGVLTPTTGSVTTNGNISALLELGAGFNPQLTGIENIYFNGTIMGYTKEEMDAKIEDILSFADIGEFVYQPVKTYSSGMFVRLAFSLATTVKPDIFMVDEALAVGDVFFRQKCYQRLEHLKENGVTIVLVTHAMTDVEQFCQSALLLEHGKVTFDGKASEAVKKYYLIEQKSRAAGFQSIVSTDNKKNDRFYEIDKEEFWPKPDAFFDISKSTEISNGWARCTGVALCNEVGDFCRIFQQGEQACFYYEFEILHDIAVPIGGTVIFNEKNIIVHGKSTLEYGSEVSSRVAAGSRLRFKQEIYLEVSPGEYTFEIGLATMAASDYGQRVRLSHMDLHSKAIRICHIPTAGNFSVIFRKEGRPVQLLHHGLCNLPGSCQVRVVSTGK